MSNLKLLGVLRRLALVSYGTLKGCEGVLANIAPTGLAFFEETELWTLLKRMTYLVATLLYLLSS